MQTIKITHNSAMDDRIAYKKCYNKKKQKKLRKKAKQNQ